MNRLGGLGRVIRQVLGRLTLAAAVALAAALVFAYVAHEMGEGETRQFDAHAVLFLRHHRSPLLYALLATFTTLASTVPLTVTVILALIGFARAGRFWPDGVSLIIADAGGAGLIIGLKLFFHRARPAGIFAHLGYSFPSGHAFFALTVYGMLAYLLARRASPRRRRLIWGLAIGVILLVGFSRVYLGVHYPSDVIGGYLLALPWLWGCLALPGWLNRWRGG